MAEKDFKTFLERVLREYEKDSGLIITSLQVGDGFDKGDGFMSESSVAKVVGKRGSGESYSNNVFIKRPVSNATRAELYGVKNSFKKESLVYNEILPLMAEGKGNLPKCYFASEDCIVMENLKEQGYIMADRKMGLDVAHCKLVMKAIGNFHASTYNLIIVKREGFSQIFPKVTDKMLSNTLIKTLESSLIKAINNLKHLKDESLATAIQKLEKYKSEMVNTLRKLQDSNLNVLGHGDFWLNNVMFRYQDGVVQDVRIVDLQTVSLMSPAPDLWKFLYTSLTPELLEKNCDNLISTYCTTFRDTLTKLKHPKDKIPEVAVLKEEIYSRERYGFLIATLYLPAFYVDFTDASIDLDKMLSDPNIMKYSENDLIVGYGKRLAGLLRICESKNLL